MRESQDLPRHRRESSMHRNRVPARKIHPPSYVVSPCRRSTFPPPLRLLAFALRVPSHSDIADFCIPSLHAAFFSFPSPPPPRRPKAARMMRTRRTPTTWSPSMTRPPARRSGRVFEAWRRRAGDAGVTAAVSYRILLPPLFPSSPLVPSLRTAVVAARRPVRSAVPRAVCLRGGRRGIRKRRRRRPAQDEGRPPPLMGTLTAFFPLRLLQVAGFFPSAWWYTDVQGRGHAR